MESFLQEVRHLGYNAPPRRFQSVKELREYYQQVDLEDMTVNGLIRLAQDNRIDPYGSRDIVIERLRGAGIKSPALSNVIRLVINKLIPFPLIDFIIPIKQGDLLPDSLYVTIGRHFRLSIKPKEEEVINYLNSTFSPGTIIRLQPYRQCVNRLDNALYDYEEKGITYCFNDEDERLINQYEVNPYTGRSLSLTDQLVGPNVADDCTSEVQSSDQFTPSNPYISAQSLLQYPPPRLDIPLAREATHFKRCQPVVLYRGIVISNYSIPSQVKFFFPFVTSWTTDINVAKGYTRTYGKKSHLQGIILRAILGPEDILVDGTVTKGDNHIAKQREVRVRPGVYEVEVIRGKRFY